jgi:transposase
MFVQTIPEKKTGRTLIVFVEGYREGGKVKQRHIRRIGYLDEFEHLYADPIAHFKVVAMKETAEMKEKKKPITIELSPEALLPFSKDTGSYDCVKNIGYAAVSKIFYELGIPKFIDSRRKYLKLGYNLTAVMKLLVYGRILHPDSKRTTWQGKGRYFDKMDFDLNAVYRSLSIFNTYRDDLLVHLHKVMVERFGRDSTLLFYDVTNYYFEIEDEDGFRMKGVSKEHRPLPIVQMGLFIDDRGLPVAYELFPGNTNDGKTFPPMSQKVREKLRLVHIIFIADKGMMSGTNIAEIITNHNGYVFSKSVRKAKGTTKDYVRAQDGYVRFDEKGKGIKEGDTETEVSFMYKISNGVTDLNVDDVDGEKQKAKGIGQYEILFWSRKYAQRAKLERAKAVEGAMAASHSKSKDVIDNNHGRNKYLKTVIKDPETGKAMDKYDAQVQFDCAKLDEDESLDGYYILETNVVGWRPLHDAKGKGTKEFEGDFGKENRWLEKEGRFQLNRMVSPTDIIDMYRGLWKIEESFRVTKTELQARPVYVSRKDRIQAHFLTCFISLLIVRILEQKLGGEYSSEQMLTSLRQANVAQLDERHFLTLYYDRVLQKLKGKLGIEFGRNVYTKDNIKRMMGDAKKASDPKQEKR